MLPLPKKCAGFRLAWKPLSRYTWNWLTRPPHPASVSSPPPPGFFLFSPWDFGTQPQRGTSYTSSPPGCPVTAGGEEGSSPPEGGEALFIDRGEEVDGPHPLLISCAGRCPPFLASGKAREPRPPARRPSLPSRRRSRQGPCSLPPTPSLPLPSPSWSDPRGACCSGVALVDGEEGLFSFRLSPLVLQEQGGGGEGQGEERRTARRQDHAPLCPSSSLH